MTPENVTLWVAVYVVLALSVIMFTSGARSRYDDTPPPPPPPPEPEPLDAYEALHVALEALHQWDRLIAHQYSSTREGMQAMTDAMDNGLRVINLLHETLGEDA